MYYIVRLGDGGDYLEYSDLEQVATLLRDNGGGPVERHCKYGVTTPHYQGHNYVSLFLGRSAEDAVRNVTDAELLAINLMLKE